MKTLLKDMPEHMEKIDTLSILQKIKDCLIENQSELDGETVIEEDMFDDTAEQILEKLTEFVNQNYEWKGVKS
jgi:hypothetical protein